MLNGVIGSGRKPHNRAGYEYVATAAPKRPVDVRFSPDGSALYIAVIGALAGFPAGAGPAARPFPGSGVVWGVVRVAQVFRTSGDQVFRAVEMAVTWGRADADLAGIEAIGIDESGCRR